MSLLESTDKHSLETTEISNILDDLNRLGNLQAVSTPTGSRTNQTSYTEEELQKRGFGEGQIQEILLGIEQHLPVQTYVRECYNWKQMQEIRLGLLEKIDTSLYENPLFSDAQMREIRLGLIDDLDVSSYTKLIYSASDMSKIRRQLLAEIYQFSPNGFAKEIEDKETGIHIRISNDCMQAFMMIPKFNDYSEYELKRLLMRHEIVHGILMNNLKKIVREKITGKEVLVAQGEKATTGQNGTYEFFFNKLLPESPKVREDGSVDYTNVISAERVSVGDPLAAYHPSSYGKAGETVTGITLEASRGKDLPPFTGRGFIRNAEKNLYTAAADGFVALDEIQYTLNIWNVFVVNEDVNRYNGTISYDGSIHIKGNVSDMAVITASGDVIIDGFVEGARIEAGGNVILKRGANTNGNGYIRAGGKVMGNFFEYINIGAKGRIEGNYFLNCKISTDNLVLARGNKARIMGGEIKAVKGVESFSIGNYGKGETIIDVGNISWLKTRMSRYQHSLDSVKEELRQLEAGKDKLRNFLGSDILEQNSLFQKTCLAIQVKNEQKTEIERELDYYLDLVKATSRAYVKATGKLQEGVVVIINGNKKEITKTLSRVTLTKTTKKKK